MCARMAEPNQSETMLSTAPTQFGESPTANAEEPTHVFANGGHSPSPPRKRIFYGVAGEGLGHASRAVSVIDHLPECEVHVFTFGKAFEFFAEMGYPHLHRIEGMLFSYRRGRVDYTRTLAGAARYWFRGMRRNIRMMLTAAHELKPELFITDFEPSSIRAAHRLSSPVLSVDNQRKFACCEPGALPRFLRAYVRVTGVAVKRLIPRPTQAVIATFHADHLTAKTANVTLTGGILRREVEEIPATNEGFVLVYLRDSVGERMLRSLSGCGREVRVYGANATLRDQFAGEFNFQPLSPEFVRDLAACDRMIGTAGNQLLSECRYFGKPLLAVPEPGQYEQHVNAHYVERIGLGRRCDADALSPEIVRDFLDHGICRAKRIPNGIDDVIRVIRSYTGTPQP